MLRLTHNHVPHKFSVPEPVEKKISEWRDAAFEALSASYQTNDPDLQRMYVVKAAFMLERAVMAELKVG